MFAFDLSLLVCNVTTVWNRRLCSPMHLSVCVYVTIGLFSFDDLSTFGSDVSLLLGRMNVVYIACYPPGTCT